MREDRATVERDLALDKLRVCEEFCALAERRARATSPAPEAATWTTAQPTEEERERADVVAWLRRTGYGAIVATCIEQGVHVGAAKGGG